MALARSSKTLESVTKRITLNGQTLVQEEMRFGLADNEIGQMAICDIEYLGDGLVAEAAGVALSLDPDSNLDPLSDDVEDLEYLGGMNIDGTGVRLAGTVGKTMMFPDKVNFGTNIGLTALSAVVSQTASFIVTIWFLRKKASTIELAKILLKRR